MNDVSRPRGGEPSGNNFVKQLCEERTESHDAILEEFFLEPFLKSK
jgi:hypothetical protein